MKIAKNLKNRRGQNTAEYLIMLTIVAIGSIGLMTAFGKTIHSKIAYVSAAISGESDNYTSAKDLTKAAAGAAIEDAKTKKIGMHGIAVEDLESTNIGE